MAKRQIENRQKANEYQIKYYERNHDKIIKSAKVFWLEDRENQLIRGRKWKRDNIDRIKEYGRQYAKKNSDKYAERSARRGAGLKKATPIWANIEDIRKIYSAAKSLEMVVDHIIPLNGRNVCGLHVPENLQLMPRSENCRKNNILLTV